LDFALHKDSKTLSLHAQFGKVLAELSKAKHKSSFHRSRLLSNLEYFSQFFIKIENQFQFWNPHDELFQNIP